MDTAPDNESVQSYGGEDRRASERIKTHRSTVFSAPPERMLCQGTVVDISASGLQIRTHAPIAPGLSIEIEVQDRDGQEHHPPVYGRAVVVWTRRMPDGATTIGVRLRTARPPLPPEREPGLDTSLIRPEHRPTVSNPFGRMRRVGDEVRFRAARRNERRGGRLVLPFLLLMALVLVLTGLLWTIFQDGVARIGTAAVPEQNPSVQEPAGDAAPTPNTTVKLPQESQFVPPDEAQWGVLDAGYERLLEGMPGSAVALFRSAQKDPLNNPAERFAARVGEAEALLVQDERNEAVSVLDDALKEPEGVAEPWRAVARDLRLRILRGEDVGAPVLFARVLEYAERNMETAKEVPLGRGAEIASATSTSPVTPTPSQSSEATGIRLEVSGSRYLLTVLEGDRTLGIFPVGLGRNRATPMGDFEVVNKILEPDWYNRGRVVKAGDPDNPLGELWVGLGEDGRPTSYGIHPTGDADSVGRDRSAGCIRMRPDDARKVFGWVKVGTPVRIGP